LERGESNTQFRGKVFSSVKSSEKEDRFKYLQAFKSLIIKMEAEPSWGWIVVLKIQMESQAK